MSEPIITKESKYNQGEEGGKMDVGLLVDNGSPGAVVEFHSTTRLPDGQEIRLPPTTISQPRQIVGVQADIPAHWETVFVYSYNPMGQGIPPGFEFSMRVVYALSKNNQ